MTPKTMATAEMSREPDSNADAGQDRRPLQYSQPLAALSDRLPRATFNAMHEIRKERRIHYA